MPDISNLLTTDVVGPTDWGGLGFTADGEVKIQNDAGTNAFTIDVNGSAELQVVDNEIGVPAGGSFSVYNVGGPGDTNYERLRMYWDTNEAEIISEAGGTGTSRKLVLDATGMDFRRFGTNILQVLDNRVIFAKAASPSSGSIHLGETNRGWGALYIQDSSVDPSTPSNGYCVLWQSDGTGSGDDGDIMMKIVDSSGTTKTATLVDFSALP